MINDLDRLTQKFRGTGRTTEQIKNAPQNALFVCEHHVGGIEQELGREDLTIISRSQIHRQKGKHFSDVIVDHDSVGKLTWKQFEDCMLLKQIIKSRNENKKRR